MPSRGALQLCVGLLILTLTHCRAAAPEHPVDTVGQDADTNCVAESLVADALPSIRARLEARTTSRSQDGQGPAQLDELLAAVRRAHLPGLLTLLAVGQPDTGGDSEADADLLPDPISWEALQQTIRAKYGQAVHDKAHDALVDRAVNIPGLPLGGVSARELEQAATLLRSGQFESDVRDLVATALDAGFQIAQMDNGTLLGAVLRRGPRAISREWLCLEGLRRPGCMWREWPAVAKSLLTTGKVGEHELYRDTLEVLTGSTVGATAFTTIGRLLDNDTVRLALILYARTQGVAISDAQLRQVGTFFHSNTDASHNLATLIEPALSILTERYHGDRVLSAIQRLANRHAGAQCRASL